MNKARNGFSVIELVIIVIVVGIIGLLGWKAFELTKKKDASKPAESSQGQAAATSFIWRQTEAGWEAQGNVPACPEQPLLKAPADLSKVTSVLYPGQTRGGNYKTHGGLRFDTTKDNTITVVAPFDGYIVKAARNFAQGTTEVQYDFDIMSNCGIMTRIGHLRELPASMQKIVEQLPEPTADSRIETLREPVRVAQNEVLATKVGLTSEQNTFFDWGVYDYRQENEASKQASYKTNHPQGDLAWHAVCWLQDGWLPVSDQATLSALPAGDPTSGKSSDYCI